VVWTRGMETVPLPEAEGADYSHTSALGELLYTDYLFAFEVAAVLLLVAIIAAIALTHRRRPEAKYQDVGRQVRVKRDERLRVVKMKSEGEAD